jgi:hypothetical protein
MSKNITDNNKEHAAQVAENMHRKISPTRKKYIIKFIFRCIVFAFCAVIFFYDKDMFRVIDRGSFFSEFSFLHVLWAIWILDMLLQIIPIRNAVPLGSQKHMKIRFVDIKDIVNKEAQKLKEKVNADAKLIKERANKEALKNYVVSTTKAAYRVFLIWVVMLTVLGVLYYTNVIGNAFLLMVTVCFYVGDLVCVLIWCPFRLIVNTRCCTTCRIFNWDHLMMFTPILFIGSLYSTVLVLLSVAVWIVWEASVFFFPERFWEKTNYALRCSECTDKLCSQYCKKLRK